MTQQNNEQQQLIVENSTLHNFDKSIWYRRNKDKHAL